MAAASLCSAGERPSATYSQSPFLAPGDTRIVTFMLRRRCRRRPRQGPRPPFISIGERVDCMWGWIPRYRREWHRCHGITANTKALQTGWNVGRGRSGRRGRRSRGHGGGARCCRLAFADEEVVLRFVDAQERRRADDATELLHVAAFAVMDSRGVSTLRLGSASGGRAHEARLGRHGRRDAIYTVVRA